MLYMPSQHVYKKMNVWTRYAEPRLYSNGQKLIYDISQKLYIANVVVVATGKLISMSQIQLPSSQEKYKFNREMTLN